MLLGSVEDLLEGFDMLPLVVLIVLRSEGLRSESTPDVPPRANPFVDLGLRKFPDDDFWLLVEPRGILLLVDPLLRAESRDSSGDDLGRDGEEDMCLSDCSQSSERSSSHGWAIVSTSSS